MSEDLKKINEKIDLIMDYVGMKDVIDQQEIKEPIDVDIDKKEHRDVLFDKPEDKDVEFDTKVYNEMKKIIEGLDLKKVHGEENKGIFLSEKLVKHFLEDMKKAFKENYRRLAESYDDERIKNVLVRKYPNVCSCIHSAVDITFGNIIKNEKGSQKNRG